jgi:hypothetical protein
LTLNPAEADPDEVVATLHRAGKFEQVSRGENTELRTQNSEKRTQNTEKMGSF